MQQSTPLCLFTGRVKRQDDEYVLTIPEQEIELGTLHSEETYRVGIYTTEQRAGGTEQQQEPTVEGSPDTQSNQQPVKRRDSSQASANSDRSKTATDSQPDQPPVAEGETLEVEIEGMGEKGDGLAKVGPGYVVFVSNTEIGQQPLVRVTAARENFAFAEVVEQ